MKLKFLLGSAFVLFMTINAQAQEFGARIGGNFSRFNYSVDEYNQDALSLFSLHIGATAILPINDNIRINGSLLYSQKGERFKDNGSTLKEVVNYIHLPFAVEYSFGGDQIKPFIQAGPYFSIAYSYKDKLDSPDLTGEVSYDIGNSESDDIAPTDFGLNIGGGLDIEKFRIGLNYEAGISNLFPNGWNANETWKNSSFNINVSYFINR
ncbi:porin family protein [Mangrovivirga sp. M17]|uniref:Porin family protein n=1 Tax=Mangrovivirga halotolerans TaxID=2993936 RepID=A0ABT3RWI1_9BACT|nr:porin family protein [Mangrovivirga halotolerans]MCX2745689.1 porin family protein [Mangrovivirga halotolerans]